MATLVEMIVPPAIAGLCFITSIWEVMKNQTKSK